MTSKFHNPLEGISAEAMMAYQWNRLQEQLHYVYNHAPFYRDRFLKCGLHPQDIKSLSDFNKIPITRREDLSRNNDRMICVPSRALVDIGATTGTTGAPILLPVTYEDLIRTVETIERNVVIVGITPDDIVQFCIAFDQLFSAGTVWYDALRNIGATSVRMGPGNIKRQIDIMQRLGCTAILATPDFMLGLAQEAKNQGLNPRTDFKLRKGIFLGQSLHTNEWKPNALSIRIQEEWGLEVHSLYGSTEMFAGFVECTEHGGHHVHSDHFLMEILDPDTGDVVAPGEPGELVITHLLMKGMPLIRYGQGDITTIDAEPCKCGRTTPRIMAIRGRIDQMIKVKGVSIYPEQIEETLMNILQISAYVIDLYTDASGRDQLRIKIAPESPNDGLFSRVSNAIKARTRIAPDIIEWITEEEAHRICYSYGSRKPKHFWDKRAMHKDE
jgi:phenylacetate-CoA ligase